MSVVILDFGSQYTRLIARRIRELHAYSVILPGRATVEEISRHNPQAVILSGGPASVLQPGAPQSDEGLFDLNLPILGICYGMQYLVRRFGGRVIPTGTMEYGRAHLIQCDGPLFGGLEDGGLQVWMSHSDAVADLPSGWRGTACTEDNPIAAVESPDKRMFGVQFHPEVAHTPQGKVILANFLRVASVPLDWTPEHTLERLIAEVRKRTDGGRKRVLLAVSGGVDSSTLALLLTRAGIEHTAVFVDHGLLRLNEREEVEQALLPLGVNLVSVDASKQFVSALAGISDPEEKRKVIGREFIAVFREKALKLGPFHFLAQGTLYPDVIESAGSEGAASIKSHHNVGGLPDDIGFELLEPFRYLFKDEVRELAGLLGLPEELRMRHPFPGPGLAIRIIGEITPERLRILQEADSIFISSLKEAVLYDQVWQALTVLTPVKSVGVVGDERRYGYILALRAVTSVDGMTADWSRLSHEFLDQVAARITRNIPQIGRVVYDITSKPPATIEWE
ncbi:MAG: glutamine-hydrolyzing GMP synthase [Candidatus Bipolaricaulota bacterium]|nr:glutamine-hydrolyzing GMP synthase [Candidatus Bipolaricaulota bacterium]